MENCKWKYAGKTVEVLTDDGEITEVKFSNGKKTACYDSKRKILKGDLLDISLTYFVGEVMAKFDDDISISIDISRHTMEKAPWFFCSPLVRMESSYKRLQGPFWGTKIA